MRPRGQVDGCIRAEELLAALAALEYVSTEHLALSMLALVIEQQRQQQLSLQCALVRHAERSRSPAMGVSTAREGRVSLHPS